MAKFQVGNKGGPGRKSNAQKEREELEYLEKIDKLDTSQLIGMVLKAGMTKGDERDKIMAARAAIAFEKSKGKDDNEVPIDDEMAKMMGENRYGVDSVTFLSEEEENAEEDGESPEERGEEEGVVGEEGGCLRVRDIEEDGVEAQKEEKS